MIGAGFNQMWTLRVGQPNHYLFITEDTEETKTNDFMQAIIFESITRFGTWMLLFA